MSYYVLSNKMPEERAELRLVIKIGSVYEAENEVCLTLSLHSVLRNILGIASLDSSLIYLHLLFFRLYLPPSFCLPVAAWRTRSWPKP